MPKLLNCQATDGEIYLAGQRVPAGKYSQIGSRREVCLDKEDNLPASLDGRVACYERFTSQDDRWRAQWNARSVK